MAWPSLNVEPGAINSFGFCWVCGGKQNLELHHIIPQAYGGRDGPQVSLCSIDHAALDKIKELTTEYAARVRPGLTAQGLTRLLLLCRMVVAAKQFTSGDPNKSIVFSDRFPAATVKQLKALTTATKMNQSQVVRKAIADLHRRLIGG